MWNQTLTDLNYKLAELYLDSADAQRISTMTGLPVAQIKFDGMPLNFWFSVLTVAQQRGNIPAIIRLVVSEKGEKPIFTQALNEFSQNGSPRSDTSTNPVNQPVLDFKDVRNLIGAGRTKDAITLLLGKLERMDKDLNFRAIQLQGQFSVFSKDQMLGTLSHSDAAVRSAQIVSGLLELVKEAEEQLSH